MFAESRRLRGSRRNACVLENQLHLKAFRRLLLQIGGANIAGADRALEPAELVVAQGPKSVSLRSSSARRGAIRLIAPLSSAIARSPAPSLQERTYTFAPGAIHTLQHV
jgi:hypothetical protein